jgi:hypothetical protein
VLALEQHGHSTFLFGVVQNVEQSIMSQFSFRQRIRYRFDNFMSRGGSSIFIGLVVLFVSALLIIGILRGTISFFHPDGAERYVKAVDESGNPIDEPSKSIAQQFLHQFYQAFNHLSDPGTMAYDIDSSPFFKATAVLAGMVGVVIFSALIAFITTALDQKISELKKGHSKVVESDHTLILGWNERVVEVLRELFIANESEDDACVVVLAKMDKEEMDDYLKIHLPDRQNTRIVTRSGAESSLINLNIASVEQCKSIIVLASCSPSASDDEKEGSDSIVIKTILAAVASLPDDADVSIVAEIYLDRNRKIVEEISPDAVTVDTDEILAKMLVQTSRSVGLSVVYNEVLSFDGCEMYFHEADWGDINFSQLPFRFPDGVPLGIRSSDGDIHINPPLDTKLKTGDAILILAEDDSTIEFMDQPVATPGEFVLAGGRREVQVEKNLIIGWTPKVRIILAEYADYVQEGSQIDIMLRAANDDVLGEIETLNRELAGIHIQLINENPLTRTGLIAARPFEYDNIIILSQGGDEHDEERTDSETVVILLLLRQIFDDNREKVGDIKLITEILDSENQPLVARAGVNDFIISNRFVSMILAQISEDADIKRVYDDLFSEDGSEIYLKPATLYFREFPITVSYADMIAVAQQRQEVCLGVKIKKYEDLMDKNFGVKLIPEKTIEYTLGPEDTLVVLAEDET